MPSPHPASQSEPGRVESQARGHHFFSRFFRRLVSPAVRGLLVWGSGARAGGRVGLRPRVRPCAGSSRPFQVSVSSSSAVLCA